MDLKRVRHFLALAETLNFTTAAASLGISQPALSKSVQRLEEELGGALLRREGKRSHLTPLGRSVIADLRAFETAGRRLEAEARRLTSGRGPSLEVAVMCTIGPQPLGAFLAAFRAARPDITLVLHDAAASTIRDLVLSGMVDLALIADPVGASPQLRQSPLFSEEMVVGLAADHPLATHPAFEIRDLERAPYIDRLACELRDTVLTSVKDADLRLEVAASVAREDWILGLLTEGAGIAVLPASLVDRGDLVTRPFAEGRFRREVSLAVPVGRVDTEAVRAFVAAVRRFAWHRPERMAPVARADRR